MELDIGNLAAYIAFLLSLVSLAIHYRSHRTNNIPKVKGSYWILKDKENDAIRKLKENHHLPERSSFGYFLQLTIFNDRKRNITITNIVNKFGAMIPTHPIVSLDGKNTFGIILEDGDRTTFLIDISKDGVRILKNSDKIYALDNTERKHLLKKKKLSATIE